MAKAVKLKLGRESSSSAEDRPPPPVISPNSIYMLTTETKEGKETHLTSTIYANNVGEVVQLLAATLACIARQAAESNRPDVAKGAEAAIKAFCGEVIGVKFTTVDLDSARDPLDIN